MSIQTEITRLQTARNTIRNKVVELGIGTNTDKMDVLATAIEGIENRGSVSASVQEGATYTIPKGYHNGSGTVSGVSGGGNYSLQSKSVTPTKKQQSVTPDSGYYGLSDVTVGAIPDAYQDVSSVTAGAADVLANKVIVETDGTVTAGTMTNNGAVSKTLDTATKTYTIPKGYHNGSGTVKITTEDKSVTPTGASQTVTPTSGKVLGSVTVHPISEDYVYVGDMTNPASDAYVLSGYEYAYCDTNGAGVVSTGTMPNNGAVTKTLDTTTTSVTIAKGYHNGSGKVSLVTETKTATPTKSTQNITPTSGKVLSKVTINPIPAAYQDVTSVTAEASHVLDGKKIVSASGTVVTGAMPNNGSVSNTIDGLVSTKVTIPAGYTTGGTVSLTNDIEEALAAI